MTYNLSILMLFACTFVTPALAKDNQNTPEERYGTYKVTARPGYLKSIGLPLCDPSAEKILDKWRGLLIVKYSKGTVWVNEEQWTFDGDYPLTNVVAHRPTDPKINGRIEATFKRSQNRGLVGLVFSDEGRTCQTSIAFIGKWAKP